MCVYVACLTFNIQYFFRCKFPQSRSVVFFRTASFVDSRLHYIRVVTFRTVDRICKQAQLQRYSYSIKFQKTFGTKTGVFLWLQSMCDQFRYEKISKLLGFAAVVGKKWFVCADVTPIPKTGRHIPRNLAQQFLVLLNLTFSLLMAVLIVKSERKV